MDPISVNTNRVRSFQDLAAWQRPIELCIVIYALTAQFPKTETFGLSAQLRRAAVSVASNVAEGHERMSTLQFLQFLGNARGSNGEVATQLVIAKALGFGAQKDLDKAQRLCIEVGKLLNGLIKSLRSKLPNP
jgi:four helix bundle protein